MPTSQQEAERIITILGNYLAIDDAYNLIKQLDNEVGKHTDNESLAISLTMLRSLLEHQVVLNKVKSDSNLGYLIAFYALVSVHLFAVIANLLALILIPFLADWYLVMPLMSLLITLNFSRNIDCPITRLENYLRVKLGKKKIGGFVGHYFIKPLKKYKCQYS